MWAYPCIYIDLCTVPYSISLHGCFKSHMLSLEFTCIPDDYPVPQSAPSTCHVLVVQCDRCQPKPAGRIAFLSQYSLVMALWDWKHLSGVSVSGALERLGRLSTLLHCHILSGHHAPFFFWSGPRGNSGLLSVVVQIRYTQKSWFGTYLSFGFTIGTVSVQ